MPLVSNRILFPTLVNKSVSFPQKKLVKFSGFHNYSKNSIKMPSINNENENESDNDMSENESHSGSSHDAKDSSEADPDSDSSELDENECERRTAGFVKSMGKKPFKCFHL